MTLIFATYPRDPLHFLLLQNQHEGRWANSNYLRPSPSLKSATVIVSKDENWTKSKIARDKFFLLPLSKTLSTHNSSFSTYYQLAINILFMYITDISNAERNLTFEIFPRVHNKFQ